MSQDLTHVHSKVRIDCLTIQMKAGLKALVAWDNLEPLSQYPALYKSVIVIFYQIYHDLLRLCNISVGVSHGLT